MLRNIFRKKKEPEKLIKKLALITNAITVKIYDEYGAPRSSQIYDVFIAHDGDKFLFLPLFKGFCDFAEVNRKAKEYEAKIFNDPNCPIRISDEQDKAKELCKFINHKEPWVLIYDIYTKQIIV